MDFALTEEQQELAGLAARILDDRMDLQHLKERDRSDDWYDLDTWREFAKANLLGIALPESVGGLGLGFLDLCMVLREVGRNVAPLPADPDARERRAADRALRHRRAARDARRRSSPGDVLLTAALVEYGAEPEDPQTTATRDGDGWRIDGVKGSVPGASGGELILVPARVGDDVAMFLVPDARGGHHARAPGGHEPRAAVRDDARRRARRRRRAARVARPGPRDPRRGRSTAPIVATCALVSGVADKALRLTAQYTTERKQFDRADRHVPGRRPAHGRLLHRQPGDRAHDAAGRDAPRRGHATTRSRSRPRSSGPADGGNHIGHAALHIHGGISIDVDFPIHRYFLWLKRYEFSLGSATPELLRIGKVLADTPVPG